ncbi:hypothetical protein SAY87_001388 [Trapa incisa]|uniref:Uncharacterized protein n=1 Tax=Trapa incisa TaxID=236973 RepID=A0AAN7GPG8_9MYRT|nr:hypothetical protein SAY87_001388 [Trapa incisa]
MWEFCSLNKLWDGEPSEKVQMPFVPSESDGIPKVANEGSRLDIPEGPLGSLIAGTSMNFLLAFTLNWQNKLFFKQEYIRLFTINLLQDRQSYDEIAPLFDYEYSLREF